MQSGLREPQFRDYPDKGCSLHPKCLECPRSACRYDKVKTRRAIDERRPIRDENVREQRALGASIEQLVQEFGLSKRTIFRITAGIPGKAEEEA